MSIIDSFARLFKSEYSDAANSLRVSEKQKQVSVKQFRDEQPLFVDRVNINGATQVYDSANGAVNMSVPASIGAKAIAQSKQWGNYLTGNSQKYELTGYNLQLETDVVKRIGYFSSNTVSPYSSNYDGGFLSCDGVNGEYVLSVVKNGVIVESVTQSNWNTNTMLGYDFSNFTVFGGDFLYLGGTAWAFGFKIGRKFQVCHVYNHSGNYPGTMIQSPNQPLRWEIESFGGEGSMQQVCGDIVSEGGEGEEGTNTGFVVEDFQANNAGIEYAVAGLRLKEAYRNTTVISQSLSLLTENNDDCIWRVTINPTVSGTVTWVPEPGSSIEIFKGTTSNVVTPGTGKTIAIGVMPGNSQVDKTLRNALGLGSYLDGTTDRIFVTIEPISAGLDVFAGVTVQEYI